MPVERNPQDPGRREQAFIPDGEVTTPGGAAHRVSAVYPTREEAEAVRGRLIGAGFAAGALDILHEQALPAGDEDDDVVLKDVLVDGAIGTAVGTGIGAVGTVAIWAANLTLFVASPVIAPLAMLGWFAGLGGVVGALAGARLHESGAHRKEGRFSELVLDAIKSGHVVLVARTNDDAERHLAETTIRDSLKGRDEAVLKSD